MAGDSYVVWGYLAGSTLPPNIASADDARDWFKVTWDLPASFREIKHPGVAEVRQDSGTWVAGTPRRTRVYSKVALQVRVRVDDQDDAMSVAQREVMPRHLAALSAWVGNPLYCTPIAFHRAEEPENWLPRMSQGTTTFWRNPPFREAVEGDEDTLASLAWAAELDATGRAAAADMALANSYLHSRTDDAQEVRALLLTYFFVIERIANRVARYNPLAPTDAETGPVIDDLEHALDVASRQADKVKAVHDAARALQGLHSRGIRRSVREAGQGIGLPGAVIQEAVKFCDLRSRELGHVAPLGSPAAATGSDPEGLLAWIDRAQACAHAYLSAYLHWVGERGVAAID